MKDIKKIFVNIPAAYLWDDDSKCWIISEENGWKTVDSLNAKHLINLSVRRSTIGLLPDDEAACEIEYTKAKGNIDEEKFDYKAVFKYEDDTTFEYYSWVNNNEDEKYAEFVVAYKTHDDNNHTICYGSVRWGETIPQTKTPSFITITKEIDHQIDIATSIPVLNGVATISPSQVPKYPHLSLKPGLVDKEIEVKATSIEIDGICPPCWPEKDQVRVKPFIGANTILLDTPLRPDYRR